MVPKWYQFFFGRFLVKKKAPAATLPAEKNGLWPIKCLYGFKKRAKKIGQNFGQNFRQNFGQNFGQNLG